MKTMAKVAGVVFVAVAVLGAGIIFSAFGGAKLLGLNGLSAALPWVFFLAGGISAVRRVFPRGWP